MANVLFGLCAVAAVAGQAFYLCLAGQARRGVSGTEIVAAALAPITAPIGGICAPAGAILGFNLASQEANTAACIAYAVPAMALLLLAIAFFLATAYAIWDRHLL
ncbi:hypothetical protein GCM10009838_72330 [Catenulispora subtropica]|uniref:Uncharacterized protein n=1 Tax=Catenulispora subtropica TaxID=450798 RepID=A0ABN2T1L8_9ACTN